MYLIEKIKENRELVFLAIIFLVAFIAKMYFLNQYYLIGGKDAGYYVYNIEDILETGLPSDTGGSPPVIFYYGAFLALIFGDAILAYKIGIALLSAAIVFPIYLLTRYISKDKMIALFAAFLAGFSSANMRIMVDLLKNTGGLFFGVFFLYYFIKLIDEQSKKNIALTIIFFGLMLATHFSSTAYITASITPFLVLLPAYDFLTTKKISNSSKICLMSLAVIICAALGMNIIYPGLIDETSIGTIGIQELGAKQDMFSTSMYDTYGIFILLVIPGLYVLWKKDVRYFILFAGAMLVAIMLTQPLFVEQSWLWRFVLMSYVIIAPLSAIGVLFFKKRKSLMYLIIVIFSVYTLWMFVEIGASNAFRPIIMEGEYSGLIKLNSEMPDAVLMGIRGADAYWFEAAGFIILDEPPEDMENVYFVDDGTGKKTPNGEVVEKIGRFTFIKIESLEPEGRCGDGICDSKEKCSFCKQDCPCDLPERPVCAPKAPDADIRGCVAPR